MSGVTPGALFTVWKASFSFAFSGSGSFELSASGGYGMAMLRATTFTVFGSTTPCFTAFS
ncbi:hypothetical protein D3C72_2263580 [compost metagenome]